MTARDIRFGLILAMCASYVGPGLRNGGLGRINQTIRIVPTDAEHL